MKNKPLSDEQILKKAIEKAVKNGWGWSWFDGTEKLIKENFGGGAYCYSIKNRSGNNHPVNVYELIFSHEFAKAFFGEKPLKVYGGLWNTYNEKPTTIELHEVPVYKHRLQQMVLEENPIKYLESYL